VDPTALRRLGLRRRRSSPELCSAADGRRRKPNPVFPGSIRVAVWLWSTAPAWVVH